MKKDDPAFKIPTEKTPAVQPPLVSTSRSPVAPPSKQTQVFDSPKNPGLAPKDPDSEPRETDPHPKDQSSRTRPVELDRTKETVPAPRVPVGTRHVDERQGTPRTFNVCGNCGTHVDLFRDVCPQCLTAIKNTDPRE